MKFRDLITAMRLPIRFYLDLIGLRKHDVFIDVGANVGVITRIAHAFSRCQILAVEPNPEAVRHLSKLQESRIRISVCPFALGDANKKAELYLHQDAIGNDVAFSEGGSLRRDKVNVSANNSIPVEVIDVCDFLDKAPAGKILIKLDVEGAEIDILRRLAKWGDVKKIKRIWCETHQKRFEATEYASQLDDVKRLLADLVEVNYEWH